MGGVAIQASLPRLPRFARFVMTVHSGPNPESGRRIVLYASQGS